MSIGYGAILTHQTAAGPPPVFTPVAGVIDISDSWTVESKDSTTNDSPGRTREKEPGLIDPKNLTIKLHYRKATRTLLDTLKGTSQVWEVSWQDGSTMTGVGFISDIKDDHPLADEENMDITIEKSGIWVFTPST